MALFNHATKEVTAKLVYYGPGLCGKTTNLQWIHQNLAFKSKGKLVSLATQTDRTLFFDFLPVELGTIRGMRTRMQLYTVPGQVFYESTRRMVLKGCDAVVFVADSQAAMLDANAESLRSLRQNLLVNEIDPAIPFVIQYNKRDLPTALPLSVLNARLNPRNLPAFEAIAFQGVGVEDTLKGITKLLFHWLSRYYGEGDTAANAATRGIGAPPAADPGTGPVKVTVRVPHATLKFQPEDLPKPPAPPPPPPRRRPPGRPRFPRSSWTRSRSRPRSCSRSRSRSRRLRRLRPPHHPQRRARRRLRPRSRPHRRGPWPPPRRLPRTCRPPRSSSRSRSRPPPRRSRSRSTPRRARSSSSRSRS